VTSCTIVEPAGTYGVGSIIYFKVTYSDEVVLVGGVPYLYVNLAGGRFAEYSGDGDGTNTWLFYVTVTAADVVANIEWVNFSGHAITGPLKCMAADGCYMSNRNSVSVNNAFTDVGIAIAQFPAGHVIDPSTPTVTSVYSTKSTSPYCGTVYDTNFARNCTYTVGETIDVFVQFSLPVQVSGSPTLYLETGDEDT
jgi:hypothetical protein